jgi:dTDP-4-amino-4,6-dideoxygalactose transaminase
VICPSFTFYATASRSRAAAPRPSSPISTRDAEPRPRGRGGPGDRPDAGDHAGAPVRPRDAARGLTGLGIPDRRGRGAGLRRAGRRQGRRALDLQLLPDQEPVRARDGGLVAATDERSPTGSRCCAFHGSRDKKDFEAVGYNSRLDELQAAVLRLFLGEIDGWNAARREAAARYEELGLGELCELPADEPGHVYHMYVVRSPDRDRVREALAAAGIGNASYYVVPLHLQPALRYLGWQAGSLPETEKASAENLALPMWAGIPAETQERVVSVIREAAAVRA